MTDDELPVNWLIKLLEMQPGIHVAMGTRIMCTCMPESPESAEFVTRWVLIHNGDKTYFDNLAAALVAARKAVGDVQV